MRGPLPSLRPLAALPLALVLACSHPAATAPAAVPGPAPAQAAAPEAPGPLPVDALDPVEGPADAIVTMVLFGDVQCPFTSSGLATMRQVAAEHPTEVRIAWKHEPLPFHANARPAAEVAVAVARAAGAAAAWRFLAKALDGQGDLSEARLAGWAAEVGVAPDTLARVRAEPATAAKVDADLALAKSAGANGTPVTFVNGTKLDGAQPKETVARVVEAELARARQAIGAGLPKERASVVLTGMRWNERAAPERGAEQAGEPEDEGPAPEPEGPWQVPIAGSPVRGPATALVTIVEVSDFQCPYCKRAQPTLDELRKRYGDQLRFVFKHLPLPFHPRAEPAAQLALEARAEKGDAGFWRAHDALFAAAPALEDADLAALGKELGLDARKVKSAIEDHRHRAAIEADDDLAGGIGAQGTPTFFVNGRKIVGAQPLAAFEKVVDEALAEAKALVAKGVPAARVYDELQKSAKAPGDGFERHAPPPLPPGAPSRGPAAARVVIQEFADFQCPFCRRAEATVKDLLASHPREVRLVFRHRPLDFHEHAALAAEAAEEARAQKGADGFWRMHDALFEAGPERLARADLVEQARRIGLDVKRFEAALDARKHRAAVEADARAADAAGVNGVPAFFVNDVVLSGAQPASVFRKAVQKALEGAARK